MIRGLQLVLKFSEDPVFSCQLCETIKAHVCFSVFSDHGLQGRPRPMLLFMLRIDKCLRPSPCILISPLLHKKLIDTGVELGVQASFGWLMLVKNQG